MTVLSSSTPILIPHVCHSSTDSVLKQKEDDTIAGLYFLVYKEKKRHVEFTLETPPGVPMDPGSLFHLRMKDFFQSRCVDTRPELPLLQTVAKDIQEHRALRGL